jgi:hypothetical protein
LQKYDVVFSGSIAGAKSVLVPQIMQHNYIIVGNPQEARTKLHFTSKYPGAVKHFRPAPRYRDKMKIICSSRSLLVINMSTMGRLNDTNKRLPNVPQLKSRPFEAAFCKAVMMVMYDDRDPSFNVVEEWFTPWEHFVYVSWTNISETITDILSDPQEMYSRMTERTYQFAMQEYTTESFVEKYLV